MPLGRRSVVISHRAAFQTYGLVEHILDESRRCFGSDLDRSRQLAETAILVLENLEGYHPQVVQDLWGQALRRKAAASRLLGDLPGATRDLQGARIRLEAGTGCPGDLADLIIEQAALAGAQNRFEEAADLTLQALQLSEAAGDEHRCGRALYSAGAALYYMGDYARAIELTERSLAFLDPALDPRSVAISGLNLARYRVETGEDLDETESLLERVRATFVQLCDEVLVCRTERIFAAPSASRMCWQRALESFSAAREGFMQLGLDLDVAETGVEEALLLLRMKRAAEAEKLVLAVEPAFEKAGLSEDVMATVVVAMEAARQQSLSVCMLTAIRRRMQA